MSGAEKRFALCGAAPRYVTARCYFGQSPEPTGVVIKLNSVDQRQQFPLIWLEERLWFPAGSRESHKYAPCNQGYTHDQDQPSKGSCQEVADVVNCITYVVHCHGAAKVTTSALESFNSAPSGREKGCERPLLARSHRRVSVSGRYTSSV